MVSYRGFVEQSSTKQVRGWIYISDSPATHLSIIVTLGSKTLGTAVANLHRDDLKAAGVGAGDHAFVVNFIDILDAEDVSAIEVRAVLPDTSAILLDAINSEISSQTNLKQEETSFEARESFGQQTPLFILGAARSGTSAVAQSLLQSKIYEGFEEGHLLDLAGILINTVREFYEENSEELNRDTLLSQVSIRVFDEGIKDQFRLIPRFKFLGDKWLDKTPRRGMIKHAKFLQEIWPCAKFIFMKRRAIENVSSRRRKFSNVSFEESCKDWSGTMTEWREARPLLGDAVIEIEQLDMALEPTSVAVILSKFLELSDEDGTRFSRILAAEQPERTSPRFAEVLNFDDLKWSKEDKEIFRRSCSDEMDAFGYSFDASYLKQR